MDQKILDGEYHLKISSKRLENIRQIKYSAYAIWNYVDPV